METMSKAKTPVDDACLLSMVEEAGKTTATFFPGEEMYFLPKSIYDLCLITPPKTKMEPENDGFR